MGKVIFGATFTLDQTVKKNTVPESGGAGAQANRPGRDGGGADEDLSRKRGRYTIGVDHAFRGSCDISPKCEVIMPDLV